MNILKKDFIERTRSRLKDLSERTEERSYLSAELLREVARTLHTIKGTSQTFGFSASSNLAHELEDLLAAAKNEPGFSDLKAILLEGFAILIESFEQVENFAEHKDFSNKISQITGSSAQIQKLFSREIPSEISERLADIEKKALASALADGKKIFRVHASFDLNDFATEFKKLRESLSSNGNIIATLPNPQTEEKNKIEFLIYLAADDSEKPLGIEEGPSTRIHWKLMFDDDDFANIWGEIEFHANHLAQTSGKEISFVATSSKIALADERANLIFDILLHLVRNGVDHGIETPEERIAKNKSRNGKIEIALRSNENGLDLSVKDDGNGIDLEKLRAKAIEKDLISANGLTESELLDLIFLHDFSTAETVTETSGRGVGLDAVKTMIENVNGTIGVKSRKDVGTVFDIFLPLET